MATSLETDPERGLSAAEAGRRLATTGPNLVGATRPDSWWGEVLESLTEPLVLLLIGVAVLYAILGEVADALTIGVVIVAVASVEVVNEMRAKRAIGALRALSAPSARLVRDGEILEAPARELVPGDLVLLQPGDRVPADVRLVESTALRVDESTLTGESMPVIKAAGVELPTEATVGDRVNLAFAGTLVTAGKGRGLVVGTGPDTELGRIARLASTTREPRTPLQLHMRELSGWLLWLALAFSVIVPALGVIVAHRPIQEMLLTGLTLAFATIPEELPILITIVLGLGAFDLARRHAVVKRLRAAETLGSVSVLGTDKTGTLTENHLRVVEVLAADRARLFEIGVLANDADLAPPHARTGAVGDPMDVALLEAAGSSGLDVAQVRDSVDVVFEYPFDDDRKRASAVFRASGVLWLGVKGAPEEVIARSTHRSVLGQEETLEPAARRELRGSVEDMAARGLRVIAVAQRRLGRGQRPDEGADALERDLELLGLVGLQDPLRSEARESVAALQGAGVRVLMLTGDHPASARSIAQQVGLDPGRVVLGHEVEKASDDELQGLVAASSVFARIVPVHKLRIVRALQRGGEMAAVTGDGVNDAPALREAAVGVAMGRTGTEVAREAADLVLADDNLATVVVAVRTGRTLYENLRKAVRYYLAAKVALVTASLVAVLAQLSVPFAPVQIIVLELFMDLGASTTFVAEPAEEDVMARPPRDPRQPFMDLAMQGGILGGGLLLAGAVLVPFLLAWYQSGSVAQAQTAAFAAWIVGHLVLAAFMRSDRSSPFRRTFLANRPYLLWLASALLVLVLGTSLPFLQDRLHLVPLPLGTWLITLLSAIALPALWGFARLTLLSGLRRRRPTTASQQGDPRGLGYPS